jgi:hypothetical protein
VIMLGRVFLRMMLILLLILILRICLVWVVLGFWIEIALGFLVGVLHANKDNKDKDN